MSSSLSQILTGPSKMRIRSDFAAMLIALTLQSAPAQEQKSEFFKTSDGVRIHYLEAGAGRPILFIPGWTMPAWIWQQQIDEFSKRYHVVAVDPRSQGGSEKPTYGHLPETRARDYKELVEHLGLKQPVLVGWSLACGELMKYFEQFGAENIGGLVFVDGFLGEKPNAEVLAAVSGWMNQLQQDRRRQADGFIRSIFKRPQPEEYLKRLIDASVQVPADTAAVLMYNGFATANFSDAFARIDRPLLFTYQPDTQPSANLLKSKFGDRVQLERFDGAGHALFVDDPEKFNRVLEKFVQSLPK
jgi:non-heme chloroperoxidase